MKPKIILTVFFLLISIYGQTQNVDSLVNVLKTKELTIAEQLNLYEVISKFYVRNDFEMGIEYAKKGLQLAEKGKDKKMVSAFNKHLGVIYYNKSSLDTSHVYLEKALAWALDADDEPSQMAAYGSLGNVSRLKQDYQKALDYYIKALSFHNIPTNSTHASALNNVAVIYRILNNSDRAIYYFEQALEVANKLNLEQQKMETVYGLGTIYADKQDYVKTAEYMQEVLRISKKMGSKSYEIMSTMSLASCFCANEEYDKALNYAKEGLHVAEAFGNPRHILGAWGVLADIYREMKRYKECEQAALISWEMDSISVDEASFSAMCLAISYSHLGQKDKAEYFIYKFHDIITTGNEKSLHNSIADMEIKYESEKKELRIASLEKEKQLYTWLGIAGILFAATLGIVLWQNIRNARREKQLIATRSVMDGEMGERTRLARDLHDRLSGNLSAVKIELNNAESLLNVSEKLDSCIEEVRRVAHNLMPVSLQFGMRVALDDFAAQFPNVHFHFFGEEKRLEGRVEFIVYCCANELVNNSLRHSGAKNINMQLIQDGKYVSLTVQDDGCGFDVKAVGQGIGLKNIRDRVASCNGRIDMISSPDKGSETIIELKAKHTGI